MLDWDMDAHRSIFKTPEHSQRYLEAYERVLSLWPVAHEALDLATHWGITHVNAAGPEHAPAMVLLPGFGANSTMWFPNILDLSSHYRIYALDTNGQPGKSLPTRPLTAENSAQWLGEVFDALKLENAHVVGISLGGWLGLDFAIRQPARVGRLVLLDPAASFEPMSAAFLWHSFIPIMVHPTRPGLIRYFRWMTKGFRVHPAWGELMLMGILSTRPQPPVRAVPFRDASHALNAEKAQIVNSAILEFCQESMI
jgi:pimeloyl-ACP methyl ester carboxylesterase